MPDNRDSCWTQSQKAKDPFLKAWIDDIPATTLSKAVWEFSRDEVAFKPYRWDGYIITPNIPAFIIDNVFRMISEMRQAHPLNTANRFAMVWLFCFHLPVIGIMTLIYFNRAFTAHTTTGDLIWYPIAIVVMSFLFLFMILKKVKDYNKALKERETQLARLLDHITVTSLAAYRIKAVGGKCGAWVELQFEDPSTFMVMGAPGFGHYAPQGGAGIPNNANPFGYHQPPQFA